MLDFIKSKKTIWVFFAVAQIAVLLFVFQLGMFVGIQKSGYSQNWKENYGRNFGMPPKGPLGGFEGREFLGAHGVAGIIIKIGDQDLVIKGQDGMERIIQLSDNVILRHGRENIKITDIDVDDEAVIIGAPNPDGTVLAKMIRIFSPNSQGQIIKN